jgi:Na+/melibiose symporter-like transporter
VAHSVGKRNAWLMGMTVVIIAQPCYLLLGTGDEYELLAVLALLGIGIGSFNAIPAAMKADVVDLDRLRSGEDRTALFFSVWSLANKFVLAVSAGAVLWLLGYFFGFDAKGENGPEQIQALRLVFCLLPMPFYFAAFAVVWKYPITEARHHRLIALLERRTERRSARRAEAAAASTS